MFGPKLKLTKEMMDKLKKYSEIAGYASAEEFALHALEKETAKIEEATTAAHSMLQSAEDTARATLGELEEAKKLYLGERFQL